jgi:triacylglycerol lipase
MSSVTVMPQVVAQAAAQLGHIGSTITSANAAAAAPTTGLLAPAIDEVSTAITSLMATHAQQFQAVSAQVAKFHNQFVSLLNAGANAYVGAEQANASIVGGGAATGITQAANIFVTDIVGSPPTLISATQGAIFTGKPSLYARNEVAFLFGIRAASNLLPPNLANQLGQKVVGPLLSLEFSDHPPKFLPLLLGETVQHTTFDGMPVVQITPAHPDGKYVVALYGGAFALPPSFFHWLYYTSMANQTGATIEVPIYPLVQQGGTAGVVVPEIAGFLSMEIAQHGATNVSVIGDSSGGNLALAAVEYMVAHGEPVPSSMVLVDPWLDVSDTNPNIALVHDPLVNSPIISSLFGSGQNVAPRWAGNLPETDPLVSPLYGSLNGLPPTYVYAGSLDSTTPDAIVLQQEAVTQGAPISFVFAKGQAHDWVYLTPDGIRLLPQIYQELGI